MNQTPAQNSPMKAMLLVVVAVFLFVAAGAAFLFLQPPAPYKADEPLAVIPAQFKMDSIPRNQVVAPFKIVNNTDKPLDLMMDAKLPDQWMMIDELSDVVLQPGQSDDIFITAIIPSGTETGKYSINVTAINKADSELFDTDKTEVNIRSVALPRTRAVAKRLSGAPTETLDFQVELLNDGNTAQNFELSLIEAPTGWRTRLSDTSINVPPGQTRTVTVSIDIPFGAPQTVHVIKFQAKHGEFEDATDLHVEVVPQN